MNSNKLVTADITDATPVRPAYSIVAPVFNEEETLPHFYQRVIKVMEEVGESFELVLINDGSRDGSFRTMRDLHDRDPRVRVIDFSRNFGHQIRSEEHTSELQSLAYLVCRLLLEKQK